MSWGQAWGESWGESFSEGEDGPPAEDPPAAEAVLEGGLARRRRRAVRRLDTYRKPEDIRREQLETERYLASLEKPASPPVAPTARHSGAGSDDAGSPGQVAPAPILADVAARAASAVQAKLEEAAQAATATRIADDKRRRTLALLLALD